MDSRLGLGKLAFGFGSHLMALALFHPTSAYGQTNILPADYLASLPKPGSCFGPTPGHNCPEMHRCPDGYARRSEDQAGIRYASVLH
jgi:hypothetical protein